MSNTKFETVVSCVREHLDSYRVFGNVQEGDDIYDYGEFERHIENLNRENIALLFADLEIFTDEYVGVIVGVSDSGKNYIKIFDWYGNIEETELEEDKPCFEDYVHHSLNALFNDLFDCILWSRLDYDYC